jgi:hypothetical protein
LWSTRARLTQKRRHGRCSICFCFIIIIESPPPKNNNLLLTPVIACNSPSFLSLSHSLPSLPSLPCQRNCFRFGSVRSCSHIPLCRVLSICLDLPACSGSVCVCVCVPLRFSSFPPLLFIYLSSLGPVRIPVKPICSKNSGLNGSYVNSSVLVCKWTA